MAAAGQTSTAPRLAWLEGTDPGGQTYAIPRVLPAVGFRELTAHQARMEPDAKGNLIKASHGRVPSLGK